MERLVCVSLALMMFATTSSLAQRRSADGPLIVSLPQGFDTRSCQLKYFLAGSFGGYGGFVQPKLQVSQFEIETVHDGIAVERLKAFLYCSGYQTETIAFDSVRDVARWKAQVQPKPLSTVRFSGVVLGLVTRNEPGLIVDVGYIPSWSCEFFGLADCLLGRWTIATIPLMPDNRFSIALPDLARDAAVSSFKDRGAFLFRILDSKTSNVLYELHPMADASRLDSLPVANAYPTEMEFEAKRRK
jgi:hypothetical protein